MFILLTQHAPVGNVLERSCIAFLQFTTSLCRIIGHNRFELIFHTLYNERKAYKLMLPSSQVVCKGPILYNVHIITVF